MGIVVKCIAVSRDLEPNSPSPSGANGFNDFYTSVHLTGWMMGEVQAVLFQCQINMLVWSSEGDWNRDEGLEGISVLSGNNVKNSVWLREVCGEDKGGIGDTKS